MSDTHQQFHIEILAFINSKHLQHGLRVGDYSRYRRYCVVKVGRLRKSLKRQKRTKPIYQKTTLNPESINESRQLLIPLFCAERSWSRSLEIKGLEQQNCKRNKYWLKKLKRSCDFAQQFNSLVEHTNCDILTKLESKAYYYWLLSTYHLSKKDWQEALNYIIQSKHLYENIKKLIKNELVSIYETKINELNISEKYCMYNLRGLKNPDELSHIYSSVHNNEYYKQISDLLLEVHQNKSESILIEWQSNKYHIYTDKAKEFITNYNKIHQELLQFSEFEQHLNVYDSYLLQCKESMQQFKDLIKSENKYKYIDECCNNSYYYDNVCNYMNSIKIYISIDRNTLILYDCLKRYGFNQFDKNDTILSSFVCKKNEIPKPEHFIRILDQLIQNINDLFDTNTSLENQQYHKYKTYLSIYRGIRCYFGSILMKDDTDNHKAFILLHQALEYFDASKSFTDFSNSTITNILIFFDDKSRSLKIEIDILLLSRTSSEYIEKTCETIQNKNPTIYQRIGLFKIDENTLDSNIIGIPSSPIPIPVSPLINDNLEESFIWPDIESLKSIEEQPQETLKEENENKTGFANYVKSWIWG